MKHTLTLISCVAVCCAMMASCKSAKTVEPTTEEIQAQKVALADTVLAKIDAIAEQLFDCNSRTLRIKPMELTANEKLVKPDYLLDLSAADSFLTKSQKINALGIYIVDYSVRVIYDMPLEEAKAVIIKLATEVCASLDIDEYMNENTLSVKLKRVYEKCRENGELAFFWQYCYATATETSYVIANNPELFYSKITEEQFQNFMAGYVSILEAAKELEEYDEEMAQLLELRNRTRVTVSDDERFSLTQNLEEAKRFGINHKDEFIAKRNALLQ